MNSPPSAFRLSRVFAAAFLLGFLATARPAEAQSGSLQLHGYVAGRGIWTEGRPSWLEGDFGRLAFGAGAPEDNETLGTANAQVALAWKPSEYFEIHAQGVGRYQSKVSNESSNSSSDAAGLVEAYLGGKIGGEGQQLRWRLGHFSLPTSREVLTDVWAPRYTLTLSALNSWIAEEVRPTGADLEYRMSAGEQRFTLGATAFGGNDSMGALLAWRGWSLHDRLTGFGEILPLPPLDSLGGPFVNQRDDGTKPFGTDLDGRVGWAARLRWQWPGRTLVQVTHVDNRGDRELHRGEYAWATQFDQLALELHLSDAVVVAAEYLKGTTAMGTIPPNPADIDFSAGYVLVSYEWESGRFTVRYDEFETTDEDHFPAAENNDEDGDAWTLAAFWEVARGLRLGVELVEVFADRPAAAQSGYPLSTDARAVTLELRYSF